MSVNKSKLTLLSGAIGALLVLGILIAVNALFSPVSIRSDVTDEKLYTVSDGTKTMLNDLERDVTLKFYFSKSNKRVPVPLKNFANRVRDLLKEYEAESDGKLVIEEFDPKPDSDAEEWAGRYGLKAQALDMFGTSGNLYFGIVAISGNREAAIPLISQSEEPRLEYLLTRMVSEVVREKATKLGIMSALPVMGAPSNPMMQQQSDAAQKWAVISELERQYDVSTVAMTAEEIPADIDCLLVIHPEGISEATLFAIDQFVLGGGRLFAFVDPFSLTAKQGMPQQQMMQPGMGSADLNKLLSAWGLNMTTDQLAADDSAATVVGIGGGQGQRHAAWLSLNGKHINSEDIATAPLNKLMLPFAGAFEGDVAEGLELTSLLHTTDEGFLTDARMASFNPDVKATGSKSQLPLAVRLSGSFKTAFPDGNPAAEEDAEDTPADALKESIAEAVVVLVGDVDMIANSYSIREQKFFGQRVLQPANDNLIFVLNIAEQLCGSEALIGLRSRGTFDRPFDRVKEMEKEAQLKWKKEQDRLNKELQSTQQRLNQLQQQSRGSGEQQVFVTAEAEVEIKKFRQQVFDTQQELKEVRKNLRSDIENLGMRLKFINIAAIPILIGLFGIARGIWLKKKR